MIIQNPLRAHFGGFIFGFLGTAMTRMLSAHPLRLGEVLGLMVVYSAMVIPFLIGNIPAGDALLVLLLSEFITCLSSRARSSKDTTPPGFVLVGLSFLCVIAGAILAFVHKDGEAPSRTWGAS